MRPSSASEAIPGPQWHKTGAGGPYTTPSPERVTQIVPVGTMGKVISLRVLSLWSQARKVVKQIETPRPPDPIMRRPCADREEKRVTRGSETERPTEQLDLNDPNQRGLSGLKLQARRPHGGLVGGDDLPHTPPGARRHHN